jgi:alpha-L-rhamnosidase
MEWYYGYVAGIRQQPGSVGWQKILIAPNPGSLANVASTLQTPKGLVVSRWRNDGRTFQLETEIPKGVEAIAILPSGEQKALRAGKQTLKEPVRKK